MTPSQTTMRIRAAALDVTITSDGPDAGFAEVSAVLGQLREMIAAIPHEPEVLAVGPTRNRRQRRADAREETGMTKATATPTKRRWSAEDDARLTELRAQGKSDREAAIALGRSEQAVKSRRQWLKPQQVQEANTAPPQQPEQESDEADQTTVYAAGNTWTPQDDAQLAELRTVGHYDHGIALLTGRTVAAVQARICKLRLRNDGVEVPSRKRRSPWTVERLAQARALRTEGMTVSQIAVRLGSSNATIGRALRSPETIEDSPGEGVRVARTVPDLAWAESDLEQARAVLARAEARHHEALEPILKAVREAVRKAGLMHDPADGDGDGVEDEPAWRVVDHLRRHGIDLRVRT